MEETRDISTRSVGIKYGAISAVLGILSFVIQDMTQMHGDTIFTVAGIVILISLIFLAHREFKTAGDGFMEYGQGVGIGFWLGLVSSVITSAFTVLYTTYINTNFFDIQREKQLMELEKQGLSDAQIEQAIEMSSAFTTPTALFFIGIVTGILFSVIISLVVAAFTKKAQPEFE